jgi:two-component system, OmpR family, sensor kinase
MTASAAPATGSPGRSRRWLAGRTLRTRLVAGVIALFVAACVGVGLATTIALRGFLVSRIDQQLQGIELLPGGLEQAGLGSPSGAEGSPGAPVASIGGSQRPSVDTLAAVVRPQGVSVALVPPGILRLVIVTLPRSDLQQLAALPTTGRPVTRHLSSLGEYRLLAVPGGGDDVHIVGLPLQDVSSTVGRFERIELVVFGVALLVVGLAAASLVGLSLRPLRRMTTTASEVTQLPLASGAVQLHQRVPDADPRTEVGQLGAAFNRMLGHVEDALATRQASEARLRASESRLRQFVADASHELRTPLASIRGHAELALRAHKRQPSALANALARVDSEAIRMSGLVDDLLLLARLDAGRPLASEPVDLTRIVMETTDDARAAGPDHRWLLELPDEPVVLSGDEHRLRQVLVNLLANARAHTPSGTTVTAGVHRVDGADSDVEFWVSDDGPGIAPDLQPRVFERFVRRDAARSHTDGNTGLGLAIVQAVVTGHGGTVTLTSRPGTTTFLVRLPTEAREALNEWARRAAGDATDPPGAP